MTDTLKLIIILWQMSQLPDGRPINSNAYREYGYGVVNICDTVFLDEKKHMIDRKKFYIYKASKRQ